ncbi:hypothetical protein L1O48_05740 [Ligilactobacillus equi]|uniref:hypothetical protein n=1 Tax=Ligilactobacillus equi TaxID=137357 RepID=UPI002ED5DECC
MAKKLKEIITKDNSALLTSVISGLTSIVAYLIYPHHLSVLAIGQLVLFAVVSDLVVTTIDVYKESKDPNHDPRPALVTDTLFLAIILYLVVCPLISIIKLF